MAVSFPLGFFAAYYRESIIDRLCLFIGTLGISLPNFILGALLIWAVALQLGWLQAGRWDDWSSVILPMVTLGAAPAAYVSALLRSSLIETLGEDFVRTARAKGVREHAVLARHALRNSLIPILTVMGPLTATLLTGSFVVEYVFAIPGMGRFFITAVTDRDYPLIMRYAERNTRHLGRSIFHAMVRYGPKLERKQAVLFRAVDIGAELFAMSSACSRAMMLSKRGQKEAIALADTFCREAQLRIDELFRNFYGPNDDNMYKLALSVLKGEHEWLEQGIA